MIGRLLNLSKLEAKRKALLASLKLDSTPLVSLASSEIHPSALASRQESADRSQQSCLVIEGGSLRGIFSSGVLKVLAEAGLEFDCVMGISAGALNGLSFVGQQMERAIRINTELILDPSYIGARPLRQEHSLINFVFLFAGLEGKLEPFDLGKALASPTRFVCAATDAETALPRYFEKDNSSSIINACIASASLPVLTPGVQIEGNLYFDGGLVEPILLEKARSDGYGRIVVLTTREYGFRKAAQSANFQKLIHLRYPTRPALANIICKEEEIYNRSITLLEELEQRQEILVVRPEHSVEVNFRDRTAAEMQSILEHGLAVGAKQLARVSAFIN